MRGRVNRITRKSADTNRLGKRDYLEDVSVKYMKILQSK